MEVQVWGTTAGFAGTLYSAVRRAIDRCGSAFIEADLRAHRNPTRMAAIERAARDLVRRYLSKCPCCTWPGFDVTDRIAGAPLRLV